MRILSIENHKAIIELEATELDNFLNDYLDTQYKIGYEEGYNDYRKLNDQEEEKIWGQTWSDD